MAIKIKDSINLDISKMLDIFYVNNVILPRDKITELNEKKTININRLIEGLNEYNDENNTDYKIEEIVVQGSIAMGTSVSADEKNYDIDIAIIMNKDSLPDGTLSAKRIIAESLKKKCTNMKNEPDPTGNSITIEYVEGYHLDFALYGKKDNKYYHCGATDWEERNPKSISWWFNNRNQETIGLLRQLVRYIKFFCKQNSEWLMPGGLIISILVDEALKKENLNVSTDIILKNVINGIINRLEYNKNVLNPTDTSKNLIKKEKDIQKLENLHNRLELRASKINKLTTDSDVKEINEAWNYFFGDEYFTEDFEFNKLECEDIEENIENFFDTQNNKYIANLITCQLSSMEGNTDGRTIRNYESNQPLSVSRFKNKQLIFTANNFQKDCLVLWKVRNNGINAIKSDALRGEILFSNIKDSFNYIDYNGNKRYESISFPGHHYVECYIVKDDNVVLTEKFIVNLIE